MTQYERHPLSALWGDIPGEQFEEMVEEFKRQPTRQMITLYEDRILDGWHRYRMSLEAGIEPFFAQLPEGQDPVREVIVKNANRRHLSRIQYRVGILLSYGARGQGEHGKGTDSVPFPPTIQEHIARYGGARTAWLDALAIVKAGYGPQVMAGEPAQPYLDIIRSEKQQSSEEIEDERQPDDEPGAARSEPGSQKATSVGQGSEGILPGDDGGCEPGPDNVDPAQSDMGPEGTGPGIEQAPQQQPQEPPKPKPPTPKERLEAERDALAMEVSEKAQRIEDLEREARFWKDQTSDVDAVRWQTLNNQREEIRVLKVSLAEAQMKCNDLQRAHRGALARIR